MKTIKRFEDLEVWQYSIKIFMQVLELCKDTKLRREFGIKDQITRSALSVSSNIAEGFEYNNNKEFVRFLKYAKGSCGELRSQMFALNKVGLVDDKRYQALFADLESISNQLGGFMKYLKTSKKPTQKSSNSESPNS